jgi:hypothetical protein
MFNQRPKIVVHSVIRMESEQLRVFLTHRPSDRQKNGSVVGDGKRINMGCVFLLPTLAPRLNVWQPEA